MIAVIARKEVTEIVRESRVRWSAAAVLLLLIAALASGAAGVRRASAERKNASRADAREWLAQGKRNPHGAAHFGMYAFKPVAPLALLDRGVESFTGSAIRIEAHFQNPAQFRAADDATSLLRFGELTAATVLQSLVPLLIVIAGFPLFARERESGTLRQLMSLGIAPSRIAAGKVAGAIAALALVLVPALAIGLVALALAGRIPLDRLLLLAVAYGLYFLGVTAIVVAVSARAKTARTALVTLLAFWIATTFVIPRAAADVAEWLHPTPTDRQFWAAVAADTPPVAQDAPRRAGAALQAGEDAGNRIFDEHYGALWRGFEAQARVQRIAGVLSPYLAIRDASMSVAGSDVRHHVHFERAAEDLRRRLQRYLNDDYARHGGASGFGYKAGEAVWRNAPRFSYAPPPLRWSLETAAIPFALLAAWAAAGAALLLRSIPRTTC